MNRRLTDEDIRLTCRELLSVRGAISGRQLRQVLRQRFDSVGKTARVFAIWREELSATANAAVQALRTPLPRADATVDPSRLRAVEALAAENQARAERAEYREQAHQDRWAMEIDHLREQLRAQPKYAAEVRALQERVLRLSAELQAAKALLLRSESGENPDGAIPL